MSATQLPLHLKLRDEAIFEHYFVGCNAHVIETLKAFISGKSESFVYCYGESGVGKTHLLQACCHLAQPNQAIFYVSLNHYQTLSPAIFDDLENYHVVCIDDVDAVIGDRIWEEALFHFYNRARDKGVLLLMSAKQVPQQLSCVLPDLHSRLMSALVLSLHTLSDEEKILALKMRATLRGFDLPDDVGNYLIRHCPRDTQDLFAVLDQLDKASLAAKRKLTVPFVKSVMQNKTE